jgi:hypothetical protein
VKRLAAALIGVALLATAVGAYGELADPAPAPPPSFRVHPRSPLRISGHVAGLYPGATTILHARARNLTAFPVRVVWVRPEVGAASPACDASNLRSPRTRIHRVIAAHAKDELELELRMLPSAPDACKLARFPLRYRAHVVRARGRR